MSLQAKFDVDPSLGRAWVDVERDDWEFQPVRTTLRERVNGLSYDEKSGQIVFQGNCPLDISYETQNDDDGTLPENQRFAKVTLNPQSEKGRP